MKKQKKIMCMLIMAIMCLMVSMPVSAAPKISKSKATLIKGQTLQLKVTGTQSKVTWSSNNKSVASVTSKGKVAAKKKGTATITAKAGKKKYTCKITVESPTLSKKSVTINVGKSSTIKLNGTKQKVTWKTSNSKIATVKNGKIIAKKVGTANITATVLNKKYTCKVTVKKSTSSLIYSDKTNGYTFKYVSHSIIDYYGNKLLKIDFDFTNNSGYSVSPAFAVAATITQNGKSLGYTTLSPFPWETNVFDDISNGAKKRVYYLTASLDDEISEVILELKPIYYFGNNPPNQKYILKLNGLKAIKVFD